MVPTPVITPAGLEPAFELGSYLPLLLYIGVVLALALSTLAATHLPFIKPWKPTRVKNMAYESGMDPIGSSRLQFDIRFHMVAITFLIFDVELIFLYPWAVIAFAEGTETVWRAGFGLMAFITMLTFLALVTLGYLYEWRKGLLSWR
jgi:NADH:ubiquinone oxidoreductase subunit 3 (subunit A)